MEMIDRYVYAVTRRLPESQREDIAQELRGLIEDMLEERGGVTKQHVEDVLQELGNPADLADKYGGTKRYLIGPNLFDTYMQVMKIVLIALSIGIGVSFIIETIINPQDILKHFTGMLISLFSAAAQGFAWVTIGFAVADRKGETGKKGWKISELPPIPDHNKQIKRGEAITGIVFSVLVLVFIIFSNHLFGVLVFDDGKLNKVIPFLNIENISQFLPYVYGIIGLGLLNECIKLIIGKWTVKLAIYNLILNIVSLGLMAIVILNPEFWNPTFMHELSQLDELSPQSEGYEVVNKIWNGGRGSLLVIIALVTIIDTISGFVKAYKK